MGDMHEAAAIDAATPGLDSLGGMVAGIDAEAAAALDPSQGQPGQPAPQGPDYARGAQGIVDMGRALIGGFAPGAEWDEATGVRMAASLAPVFEKYGIDMESNMPCELVALFVCGPVLYQSARGIAHKIKMDRLALADARPGVTDPNTVRGAAVAANVAPAPDNVPDLQAAERLAASVRAANVFPDM